MNSHWQKAVIGSKGTLVLNDLPFEPGKTVDVLIIPRSAPLSKKSLQNSVLAYNDPYEPIASEDWELQP